MALMLLCAVSVSTVAAHADVVARCGASVGKTFYLSASNGGWEDDKISMGAFTFQVDDKGEWDVLFTDTRGSPTSYRATGAAVIKVDSDAKKRKFMILAAFPGEGVVDTFSVTEDPADPKTRVLLWTSNKASSNSAQLTKISGMIAVCD